MDQNCQFDDELKECNRERQEVQQHNLVSQNEEKKKLEEKEQIEQNALERQRELARERSRRYRDNKHLCPMKTIQRVIHNSQIPGTSTNFNVPFVANDYSANINDYGKLDHELKPKRELANASKREQRKRKHQEVQQQSLVSQNEGKKQLKEQIEQNALERQRELTRERNRRYRDKKQQCKRKQQEVQQQNLVLQNEGKKQLKEQIEQNALERQRELARERNRRYRDNKRLCPMKTIQREIHNSQIPGTSKNMDIPIVVNDYSANVNDYERKCSGHSQEEYLETHVVPLEDQAHDHSSAHKEFHKQVTQNSFGHVCTICDRLWFKNDLKNLNDENMNFVMTFLTNVDKHSIAVCSTCRNSIQKKSVPQMAVYNGFEYTKSPNHLIDCPLDLLSERLVSPRIPFMQIRRLRHVYGQYGIYGQVINVPVEVNTMVNSLPRNINDDHCIYVHIKRKKIHKSSYLHGLVNKETITKWLRYLVFVIQVKLL